MVAVLNRVPNTRTALLDNWIWGLSLVTMTIAIHATGVTFMVAVLHRIRVQLEIRGLRLPPVIAIVIGAITAIGLLLSALHGIEAALWAAVYLWLGALGSPETAILYSLDAMAHEALQGLRSNLIGRCWARSKPPTVCCCSASARPSYSRSCSSTTNALCFVHSRTTLPEPNSPRAPAPDSSDVGRAMFPIRTGGSL